MKEAVSIGQIEQVVSSADCRSAEPNEATTGRVHEENMGGGATGRTLPRAKSAERSSPFRPLEEPGWVYFIEGSHGYIKIGWALDPLRRMDELQIGSAHDLTLIGAARGDRHLEGEYHRHLADARVRGEWFDPARSDLLRGLVERLWRQGAVATSPFVAARLSVSEGAR